MKIGDRIRKLRLVKKMTQGELIEDIASITYLSKVENNQTQPTEQFIRKISERLQIDPSILAEQVPNEFTQKLQSVYEEFWKYDRVSEEDIALLQVQIHEVHDNQSFLMIFTILIRYYYIGSHLKDAKTLFEQSRGYINEYDSSIEEHYYFHYYLICGKLLMDLYMLPQANEYLMKCESCQMGVNYQDLAKYYFSLSIVKQQLNENKYISLYYSEKSLEYQKKVGDSNRIAMVYFTRAIQYQLADQPKDAMKCLEEGKACSWDQKNIDLKAVFEYSIGRVYQVGKDNKQAIAYYSNALEYYLKSSFDNKSVQAHKRLVEIYIEEKNWMLVEKHLYQAELLAKEHKAFYYDIELDILRANVFKFLAQENHYEKAMKKIIEHCNEWGLFYHIKKLSSEMGDYFYNKNSFRKAASYYHQAFQAEKLMIELP